MAGTVKAVALVDTVRWVEDGIVVEFPEQKPGEEQNGKGQEFELPSAEFDRLEKGGAVAKPRSKDAKAAKDAADDVDAEPVES